MIYDIGCYLFDFLWSFNIHKQEINIVKTTVYIKNLIKILINIKNLLHFQNFIINISNG